MKLIPGNRRTAADICYCNANPEIPQGLLQLDRRFLKFLLRLSGKRFPLGQQAERGNDIRLFRLFLPFLDFIKNRGLRLRLFFCVQFPLFLYDLLGIRINDFSGGRHHLFSFRAQFPFPERFCLVSCLCFCPAPGLRPCRT